jgi:hypothetical protein
VNGIGKSKIVLRSALNAVRVAFSVSRLMVRRSLIVTYYLVSSVVFALCHNAREFCAVVVCLYAKFNEGELVAVSDVTDFCRHLKLFVYSSVRNGIEKFCVRWDESITPLYDLARRWW